MQSLTRCSLFVLAFLCCANHSPSSALRASPVYRRARDLAGDRPAPRIRQRNGASCELEQTAPPVIRKQLRRLGLFCSCSQDCASATILQNRNLIRKIRPEVQARARAALAARQAAVAALLAEGLPNRDAYFQAGHRTTPEGESRRLLGIDCRATTSRTVSGLLCATRISVA